MSDSQGIDNNTCVVCFKNVLYFSIGECDHPVCFECSTRMRVLCLQNECPICRQDLSRVVFTDTVLPYKDLRTRVFSDRLFERQFKIGFCTEDIKKAYDKLLEHCCYLCPKTPPYRTFTMLNDHMRKVHEKFFCDLCVKHLKIFTSERKCYARQELAHHRRKGDLDDTSHRGHPLCEFCEQRFMDADELYRHLRKEHLYCHLCDADGRNLYYASHSALQQHFRVDHFLCEEGECANQYLTAVFRSDIDLKAHKATVHGRGMTRGAARQARTLELQFNITPHVQVQRSQANRREREREPSPVRSPSPAPAPPAIDTFSDAQFPRLAGGAGAGAGGPLAAPRGGLKYKGGDTLLRNDRNFPALDGSRPAAGPSRPAATATPTVVRIPKPGVSVQLHSQPASASNFRLTQATGTRISIPQHQARRPAFDDDFPTLAGDNDDWPKDDHPNIGASSMQPPKVTLINSQEMQALQKPKHSQQQKKPAMSSEAFPALSSSPAPSATPQWITVSKAKNKPPKAEPPPKPLAFNAVADFPNLPANKTKQKKKQETPRPIQNYVDTSKQTKKQEPRPAQTTQVKADSKQTKKEKKKNNNNKKEHNAQVNQLASPVNGFDDVPPLYASSVNNNSTEADRKIKTTENSIVSSRNGGNGDFALAAQDYPPLSAKSAPVSAKTANVPIEKKVEKKVPNGSVPPGFKPRPACDGMTFTNSAGQTFPAPVHTYIAPADFEIRNRALVKKFAVALGGAAAVEDFKVASRAFRDNIISADEFYQHCRKALGKQLESVFPELVALLPDIAKQQELVVGRDVSSQLDVCCTCGQLVAPCDNIAHDSAHWPPLSSR